MKTFVKICAFLFVFIGHSQAPIGKVQTIKKPAALKCVSGNCVDGWGKWEFENGYYDGFWENSKRHGYGLYKWNEFGTYIGFWKDDKMEGYGSYEDTNGKIFSGMYVNGKLNGFGEEIDKSDNHKAGIYKDHVLVTPYEYKENDLETGCVTGNCVDGYGGYVWENGDFFAGFFKNSGPFLGTYQFANFDYYIGMFNEKGQFHGQGRFFYSDLNTAYYGGDFYNGNFEGKGYYEENKVEPKIGIWKEGKLIKPL